MSKLFKFKIFNNCTNSTLDYFINGTESKMTILYIKNEHLIEDSN